jgi:hypothetical protein
LEYNRNSSDNYITILLWNPIRQDLQSSANGVFSKLGTNPLKNIIEE